MQDFKHITDWKLQKGSHEFPGPDGGTCINEAAIVAAGFEYKKIDNANDCPPCFSRSIAQFAIRLNDIMPDDLRNELLAPFVTRLAGTADTSEVEYRRSEHMLVEITRTLFPVALAEAEDERFSAVVGHALQACTLNDVESFSQRAQERLRYSFAPGDPPALAETIRVLSYLNETARELMRVRSPHGPRGQLSAILLFAATGAGNVVGLLSGLYAPYGAVYRGAAHILDQMIGMGKNVPVDPDVAVSRMKTMKHNPVAA